MSHTILVIDDDESTLALVVTLLNKGGYTSVSINNGIEGLKKVQELRPDLVLLDRTMPDLDGQTILQTIKSTPDIQNIPVVMLTAAKDMAEITSSIDLGASDYITKPFDHIDLLERLKKVLSPS